MDFFFSVLKEFYFSVYVHQDVLGRLSKKKIKIEKNYRNYVNILTILDPEEDW